MKIGIDARFYGTVGKGLGRYTAKLIEHLEDTDPENDYYIFLRRENYAEYKPRHPRFRKVMADFLWYGWDEQCWFPFLLYRMRLDLMHFPHFNVPLLYRRPFVVTIHDLILLHYPTQKNTTRSKISYAFKYAVYRWVIASAIRRARRIIAVSNFTRKDIVSRYPAVAEKIRVTYEAADDKCFVSSDTEAKKLLGHIGLVRTGVSERKPICLRDIIMPYVLYVGNAYPHKNLGLFLRVAPLFPHIIFVLIGKEDYFYTRLRREVADRRIDNVVFAGFVSDRELSVLYRYATLYVFPSLYEGFGLPPLEALAYGLPVLSSDRGSLPEILGEAAEYFNPESLQDFRERCARLLFDETRREQLRQLGYVRLGRYHFREMAEETLRAYEETRVAFCAAKTQ